MAWDFETEPEFQEKRDWIEPLSQLGLGYGGPDPRAHQKTIRPLQAMVMEQVPRAE